MSTINDEFPTGTAGLAAARAPDVVELDNGQILNLSIAPVAKSLGDVTVRMLAYNGSIPGPTLKVRQDSEIGVDIENHDDLETTVHWHGLRLENRYDGTHETQKPIAVGEKFTARVKFPDPGLYWYHPHIRQDYGQELGLYGNVIVEPADPDYWPPVHREVVLTLDDILVLDGKVAPFSRTETTHSAMGRFGNKLLVSGETDLQLDAKLGEVVRFYLTNTANTRVFNVRISGATMKLVGGDSGRVEHEEFVDSVLLAPSERAVVDILFDSEEEVHLEHQTPHDIYQLARIRVSGEHADPTLRDQFAALRVNEEMAALRERIAPYLEATPLKTLTFLAEMNLAGPEADGATSYACPMHPEVVSDHPGNCPKCGMKLMAVAAPVATSYACPMHPQVVSDQPGNCPKCGMKLVPSQLLEDASAHGHRHAADHDAPHGHNEAAGHAGDDGHSHEGGHGDASGGGIEWEDDMVEINRMTTTSNMRWKVVDWETGAEGADIDWQFFVGDQVKIRLLNEMAGDHPMHHPFHIHGAGRFLVLSRDGSPETNLVWKDTVLMRAGETVDILLDVTEVGRWMAHCHISEHHESGMMFSFDVTEPRASAASST